MLTAHRDLSPYIVPSHLKDFYWLKTVKYTPFNDLFLYLLLMFVKISFVSGLCCGVHRRERAEGFPTFKTLINVLYIRFSTLKTFINSLLDVVTYIV